MSAGTGRQTTRDLCHYKLYRTGYIIITDLKAFHFFLNDIEYRICMAHERKEIESQEMQ